MASLLLAAACSTASDGDRLDGVWGFGEDVDRACIQELVLDAGEFKESTFCRLTAGDIAVEQKGGTFREDGGEIVFTYLRSSCPDDVRHELRLKYDVTRSMLSLSTPGYAIGLTRRPKPATVEGASVFGCFEENNTKFAPSAVREL